MKTRRAIMLIIMTAADLSIAGFIRAQTMIENPAVPPARNAGRVLELQEVWRITDAGGDFYLKYPTDLQIAADGSVFFADEGQLLHFTADGKFIKNILKKGQGPGEVYSLFTFHLHGLEVFILDFEGYRMFRLDFVGSYLGSIGKPGRIEADFLGVVGDDLIIVETEWPPFEDRTGKIMEVLDRYKFLPKDGRTGKDICTLKYRAFLGQGYASFWDRSIAVLSEDGKKLYAFYGQEYRIDVVDVAMGNIARIFRRKYTRTKARMSKERQEFEKENHIPRPEYEADIGTLFTFGNRVWVRTSTRDNEKGDLFDIFEENGRYLDCFYLGTGRVLLAVRGEHIFVKEDDESGIPMVVKYRIAG